MAYAIIKAFIFPPKYAQAVLFIPTLTKYIFLYLQVLTHHQPFSKPFSQCLCYSAHIHSFILLPSHCLTLVQRIVFQHCCAIFLTLSWSPTAPNTLDGFFSLEHTKLIPQIRNLSLCLKGFAHRFSNVLVLSCH